MKLVRTVKRALDKVAILKQRTVMNRSVAY